MRVVTFVVLLVCASQLLLDSVQDSALRIIGGRDSTPGEYPFLVRLMTIIIISSQTKTSTEVSGGCTGAALSSTWTLTAGHCSSHDGTSAIIKTNTMTKEVKTYIKYGDPHLKPSDNNKLSAILKKRKLNYHIGRTGDDIMLLYTEAINITEYARISAVDYTALYGCRVALMGFGLMRKSQKLNDFDFTLDVDKPLQVMNGVLKSCNKDTDPDRGIQMCAVPECGRNQWVYYGDSGGPVVHASGIVGINVALLYDLWEKQTTKPGSIIITPVSPFLNWIYSQLSTDPTEK